jgi:hypothetical protein
MNIVNINNEALDTFLGQVRKLEYVEFEPLLNVLGEILREDNTEGALKGLDGFGDPLIPVTYRPDPTAGSRKPIDYSIKANNNLTSGHYRTLDGPPLAPRGLDSRIVTNYATVWEHEAEGVYLALGHWVNVESIDGVPFLGAHFRGDNGLPVRNLAHVRPGAVQLARDALHGFVTAIVKRIKGT